MKDLIPKKKKNNVKIIKIPNNPIPISFNINYTYLLLKWITPRSFIL